MRPRTLVLVIVAAILLLGHWGTVDAPDFTPFNGDPKRLIALVKNPERIHVLPPGQPYTLRPAKRPENK
jgi:hypothetical protein